MVMTTLLLSFYVYFIYRMGYTGITNPTSMETDSKSDPQQLALIATVAPTLEGTRRQPFL